MTKEEKQHLCSRAKRDVETAISYLYQALEIEENDGIINITEDGNMQAALDLLDEVHDHLTQFLEER